MGPRSSYRYPTGSSTHLPVKRTITRSVSVSSEAWPRERKSKRSAVSFMMPANSRFISATDGSDRGPWKSSTIVMPAHDRDSRHHRARQHDDAHVNRVMQRRIAQNLPQQSESGAGGAKSEVQALAPIARHRGERRQRQADRHIDSCQNQRGGRSEEHT